MAPISPVLRADLTKLALAKRNRQAPVFKTLALVTHWQAWVNRRIESIDIVDDETIRRTVSVDFTLDDASATDGHLLVPLGFQRKGIFRNFSLRDEAGRALSLANRDQVAAISRRVLVGFVSRALQSGHRHLTLSQARLLWQIPDLPERQALCHCLNLANGGLWNSGPRRSDTDVAIQKMVNDLATHFILFTLLQCESRVPRVVTFAWDETLPWLHRGGWRLARLRGKIPGDPLAVDLSQVGLARSYYLQVIAPPEVWFRRVRIPSRSLTGQTPQVEIEPLPATISNRIYGYVHNPRADVRTRVLCRFRLDPNGTAASLYSLSVFTTAALGAALTLHWKWGATQNGTGAASILVALPSIYAAWLLHREEHRLLRALLKPVRIMIGLCGLISILAAATLVMNLKTGLVKVPQILSGLQIGTLHAPALIDWRAAVWLALLMVSSLVTLAMSWYTTKFPLGWLRR